MASKSKKRTDTRKSPSLSPKKYIMTKARNLPIYECLINESWQEATMAHICVVRKQPSGKYTVGFYLVDLLSRGLKDTFYKFNLTESAFAEFREQINSEEPFINIDYPLAHSIIYKGIEFAKKTAGLKPHHDFKITKFILEEDKDIPLIDIEFGEIDEPLYLDDDGSEENNPVYDLSTWTEEDWEKLDNGEIEITPELSTKILEMQFVQKYQAEVKKEVEKVRSLLERVQQNEDHLLQASPDTDEKEMELMDEELHEFAYDQPKPAIYRLKEMIKNKPNNPHYYDYLATAYGQVEEYDSADNITAYAFEKFPDHYMAKLNYAIMLMENSKLDEAKQVMGEDLDIYHKINEPKNLSYNEFLQYLLLLSIYYHETGDLVKAHCYHGAIKGYHPNDLFLEYSGAQINLSIMRDVMGEEVFQQLQQTVVDEVLNLPNNEF